jgi:hypothetical protein
MPRRTLRYRASCLTEAHGRPRAERLADFAARASCRLVAFGAAAAGSAFV